MQKKLVKSAYCSIAVIMTIAGVLLVESGYALGDDLIKRLKEFNRIAVQVNSRYVKEVDPNNLIQAAIKGMLSSLDPSCRYWDARQHKAMLEDLQNQVERIGINIAIKDGWPTVISAKEDTPAERMGIRAGDRILKINGQSAQGVTGEEAMAKLKGPKGTVVHLTIQKERIEEPMEYAIEIDSVSVASVPYYGLASAGIGYVRSAGFNKNAGNDIKEAVGELLDKNIKGLILDLRGNPGGMLDEAITIASVFLDQDRLVLETRGRKETDNREFLPWDEPLCPRLPLAVLVDEGSSAGSEIVAGAIQDSDRGIIMGDTTSGAGYVQQVFELEEGGVLKLSVAECSTPSGRSIQRREDSEIELTQGKPEFFTERGRAVYGGGGIAPDITIPDAVLSPLECHLLASLAFHRFAVTYTATYPNLPKDFEVDDAMLLEFTQFLDDQGFTYLASSELQLERLKEAVDKEARSEAVIQQIAELEKLLQAEKANDFERSKEYIKSQIKENILVKLYGRSAKYEGVWFEHHPQIKRAIEILSSPEEYKSLLSSG